MNEIRIPLPNGTQLIFFQSEQMKDSEAVMNVQPVINKEPMEPTNELAN